ncbi:hypothetical protein GCM10023144_28180 [Pigmentiphaga soli]|uniref:Glycosyltransferase 2-like domain-containing protein n=1 Tax=Pigmentiphaga soli TaxID=1007095 RepID=A0ABP8H6W4_9BURK
MIPASICIAPLARLAAVLTGVAAPHAAGIPGMLVAAFLLLYPLCLCCAWMAGAARFWWRRAFGETEGEPGGEAALPPASIVMPCSGAQPQLGYAIAAALGQDYPRLEVIAVSYGPDDGTAAMLDALAQDNEPMRVIHLAPGQDKAMALRIGALAAHGDYLVCVDGDVVLDADACTRLVAPLAACAQVGAVAGSLRRDNGPLGLDAGLAVRLAGGLIRRARTAYGGVCVVSGKLGAFRRRALEDVGYWRATAASDVDLSWRLRAGGWDIRYEPRAGGWMDAPGWRRLPRRAAGTAGVVLRYFFGARMPGRRRLWPSIIEHGMTAAWVGVAGAVLAIWSAEHLSLTAPYVRIEDLAAPASLATLLLRLLAAAGDPAGSGGGPGWLALAGGWLAYLAAGAFGIALTFAWSAYGGRLRAEERPTPTRFARPSSGDAGGPAEPDPRRPE